MKHCIYCDALMANDAIFCPKCGRKQKKFNNNSTNNADTYSTFNINIQPPATLGSKDYQPESVDAYKRKIGFNTGTSNVLFAYAGSMMGRSIAGNLVGGSIGSYIGAKSLKTFILSFEKQGILILGLNFRYSFTGRNGFINKDKIKDCYKSGFQSLCIEINNKQEINLSIPHWIQLPAYQGDNQRSLFGGGKYLYTNKNLKKEVKNNNHNIAKQNNKYQKQSKKIFLIVSIILLIIFILLLLTGNIGALNAND